MKTIFYTLFIVVLWLPALAQDTTHTKKWQWGITAIPGWSSKYPLKDYTKYMPYKYNDDDIYDEKGKLSIAAGFTINYTFSKKSSMQFSALFIDRGYNVPTKSPFEGWSRLNQENPILYVDLTALYRYRLLQKKRFSLFITGGLGPSIYLYNGNGLVFEWYEDKAIIVLEDNYLPVAPSLYLSINTTLQITTHTALQIGPFFQVAPISFTPKREYVKWTNPVIPVTEPLYQYKPYFLGIQIVWIKHTKQM